MRKIKLYIAASLNGKIARPDGSVDWLEAIPVPQGSDYGYAEFLDSVDTTIIGNKTYQQLIGWDIPFPYSGKKNYVLTRNQSPGKSDQVEFITSNHLEKIKEIKQQARKDIWLIGGGQVNTLLFNANLIDELLLFVMPVVLPDGIDLFEGAPDFKLLELTNSQTYSTGVVELRYRIKNE
ncbi:MAG TPA: dihydrofolate reductase family protein [Sunxiuqinia sp.]|nr:dihydrofolate reductase family protein [Sunxiuqinia sp.]